jgi:membrane protein YqaA with SNARE-associated domain
VAHPIAILYILAPSGHRASTGLLHWLRHLGGPGLILLGIIDSSVVPLPGSLDVLTIVLAAGQNDWWPYYGAMATIGALIGGYLTYRLARKGGNQRLERRLQGKMQKVESIFARWGFGAIVTIALLPPPAPLVPFLVAAGAAKYPRKKFVEALAIGRGIRYMVIAFLAAIYGRAVLRAFMHHGPLVLIILGSLIAAAITGYLIFRRVTQKTKSAQHV